MNLPARAQHWRHHTAVEFLHMVLARFRDTRGMQIAGSLTFTTLLSLVPLVTVVLLVTSQFDGFSSIGVEARNFLVRNLLPDRAGKVITTYALQFSQKASNLTVLGTALLLVTAVMLLQTVDRTLNAIWNIPQPRRWYVSLPTYWVVLTLGPLFFALGVFAMVYVVKASVGAIDGPGWVRGFAFTLGTAGLMSALFAYLFHAVPNRRLNLWHSIAGGLIAGLGTMLVQRLFGLYLARLPNFTLIYGTFSVLPIFLLWLYASWCAILLGATVAASLPDFLARRRLLPDTPLGRFRAGVLLVRALTRAQHAGKTSTLDALATACGQTVGSVEGMLLRLAEGGVATRTEDGDWLLCASGDRITLGELTSYFLLEAAPRDMLNDPLVLRLRSALDVPVVQLDETQIG
ncbi:MAG: YihY family inner membrane protein [Moraxellaceae bacterium]|nr:YihY family inner membrane protein [Moraxellaceae bacterium]